MESQSVSLARKLYKSTDNWANLVIKECWRICISNIWDRTHRSRNLFSFLTRPWRPAVNFPQYFHLESSTLTLLIKIASFFFLPAIQPQHMGSEKKYKHQLNLGCNRAAETITRELLGINENEAKFSFVCSDGYYRRGPGPDHAGERKKKLK